MLKEAVSPSGVCLAGLRIGVPRAFFYEDCDASVCAVIESALQRLRDAGAELVEEPLPLDDLHSLLPGVSGTIERFELPRQLGACCRPCRS